MSDELAILRNHIADLERELADWKRLASAQEAEQLRDIINSLADIVWSQDPSTWEVLYLSPAIVEVYGRTIDEFLQDTDLWIKVVYPEDRQIVENYLPTIVEQGSADVEYRIVHKDGSIRWLHDRGRAIRNEHGAIVRIDGLATNITTRKEIEAERERQRQQAEHIRLQDQTIELQKELLRELSTPLIPVAEGVLVMPLIGSIDDARAQQIIETLLNGITQQQAAIAIIDITGVTIIDTQVANTLLRTARAARLVGVEVILTGIQPPVAQTLVHLGVEFRDLTTHSTLQRGIAYALGR
jgi:rsbT co-antagonist protein RsbR